MSPPGLQLDGINLFAILSIISIFYCLPCALVLEGGCPRPAACLHEWLVVLYCRYWGGDLP